MAKLTLDQVTKIMELAAQAGGSMASESAYRGPAYGLKVIQALTGRKVRELFDYLTNLEVTDDNQQQQLPAAVRGGHAAGRSAEGGFLGKSDSIFIPPGIPAEPTE